MWFYMVGEAGGGSAAMISSTAGISQNMKRLQASIPAGITYAAVIHGGYRIPGVNSHWHVFYDSPGYLLYEIDVISNELAS